MLPRRFHVKAVRMALRENIKLLSSDTGLDLLASKIVDSVNQAAEIFTADDDPEVVPIRSANRFDSETIGGYPTGPSSPEDIGNEGSVTQRPIVNLPQPKSLIVSPNSAEGREAMSSTGGRVQAVRPVRAIRRTDEGEEVNWDFDHLYATLLGEAPFSITVRPEGQTKEIELARTFQANKSTGIIKLTYVASASQKESSPSVINPDGSALAPMSVPISEASKSFTVWDPPSLDIDSAISEISASAAKAFRPRASSLASSTPVDGRSLSQLVSETLSRIPAAGMGAPAPNSTFDVEDTPIH